MKLYFVQHGLALTSEEDPVRPLSEEGSRQVKDVANLLKSAGVRLDNVYHSGKTRAMETAELFSEVLYGGREVNAVDGMAPNDEVASFAENIGPNGSMYVGHMPFIGKIVSLLVTGDENADVIQFINGCVVCLEKIEDSFRIVWHVVPSLCGGAKEGE